MHVRGFKSDLVREFWPRGVVPYTSTSGTHMHVRKVNAERRPRVKGRFVKQGDLVAAAASSDAIAPPV
eukprot:716309-Prorocentrum_minimum.AAC.3